MIDGPPASSGSVLGVPPIRLSSPSSCHRSDRPPPGGRKRQRYYTVRLRHRQSGQEGTRFPITRTASAFGPFGGVFRASRPMLRAARSVKKGHMEKRGRGVEWPSMRLRLLRGVVVVLAVAVTTGVPGAILPAAASPIERPTGKDKT